jgi:hypothetical protein
MNGNPNTQRGERGGRFRKANANGWAGRGELEAALVIAGRFDNKAEGEAYTASLVCCMYASATARSFAQIDPGTARCSEQVGEKGRACFFSLPFLKKIIERKKVQI